VVIAYADWRVRREDPRFPVGQARLEAIGVLACEHKSNIACNINNIPLLRSHALQSSMHGEGCVAQASGWQPT
jgi:hypothetical protein